MLCTEKKPSTTYLVSHELSVATTVHVSFCCLSTVRNVPSSWKRDGIRITTYSKDNNENIDTCISYYLLEMFHATLHCCEIYLHVISGMPTDKCYCNLRTLRKKEFFNIHYTLAWYGTTYGTTRSCMTKLATGDLHSDSSLLPSHKLPEVDVEHLQTLSPEEQHPLLQVAGRTLVCSWGWEVLDLHPLTQTEILLHAQYWTCLYKILLGSAR